MHRLDHRGSKGNIIDKMAIHNIKVQPIASGINGAAGLISDPTEVSSEERGCNNPILEGPFLHGPIHKMN
jgi:hypothetical protein